MTRDWLAALAAAGALLALPAAAAGDERTAPDESRSAVAVDARDRPTPAKPRLTLGDGRREAVALRGRTLRIRGRLAPFAPGQRVIVRVYRGRRKIRVGAVAVRSRGRFAVRLRARRPGVLHVRAVHRATPELGTARARALRVRVIRPSAGPGARGPAVRLLQARLAALHYAVPRSGVFDDATARAVLAYRKVTGMRRTTAASETVFAALRRGRGAFRVRHPRDGRHVEADLSRQVLALIEGGRVRSIYHTSSGAPGSPTVVGRFRVYMKTPGVNAKGMVHSSYFIRGYAIHGYASVPPFPASHGCLRMPIANARGIFDWLRPGDVVWVYH